MCAGESITLKAVQLRLGVPQHVLIHLCEKGVIEPEFAETSGRGKRREFSQRNVFEFAVALALRQFELPIPAVALVVRLLRTFGRAVGKAIPGFSIPESLNEKNIDLRVSLLDADILVLQASGGGLRKALYLSAEVGKALHGEYKLPRVVPLDAMPSNYEARIEVNVTEIARQIAKSTLSE